MTSKCLWAGWNGASQTSNKRKQKDENDRPKLSFDSEFRSLICCTVQDVAGAAATFDSCLRTIGGLPKNQLTNFLKYFWWFFVAVGMQILSTTTQTNPR